MASTDDYTSQVREREFFGETEAQALLEASNFFKTSKENITYKVVISGSKGLLGIKKKPWRIIAHPSQHHNPVHENPKAIPNTKPKAIDANGTIRFKITKFGIFLRVTKPADAGEPVNFVDVQQIIFDLGLPYYNFDAIKKVVQDSDGEFHKISEPIPLPEADMKVHFLVSADPMKVHMTMIPPKSYGRILEVDEIVAKMKQEGIVYGIKEDVIQTALESEFYDEVFLVAEGTEPKHGKDGWVDFYFPIRKGIQLDEDEFGRVDYHELGIIINVKADQLLARRYPPEKGTPGKRVNGDLIPARHGKEATLPVGRNIRLEKDCIYSEIDGHVQYDKESISVDKLFVVNGDITLKTGNIDFLGTVIITGNVGDGFSIYATRSIEIGGSVGNSELSAGGNIIVKGGIHGKKGAKISAGENLVARFITHAYVNVQHDVFAPEGILHSEVLSKSRIILTGKRGKIIGGHLMAMKEVHSLEIGSNGSYIETIIETGLEPDSKQLLDELEAKLPEKIEQQKRMVQNIDVLKRLKESSGTLPPDKEKLFYYLTYTYSEMEMEIRAVRDQIQKLKNLINELTEDSQVCCMGYVYPGVEIIIKNAHLKVRSPINQVTFINVEGNIRPSKYKPLKKENLTNSL